MAAPAEFTWMEGVSAYRAPRIPEERWREFEAEIRELRKDHKVEDIRQSIGEQHNFWPSRGQYIAKFKEWGLPKYNIDKPGSAAQNHLQHSASLTNISGAFKSDGDGSSHQHGVKRRNSFESTRTSQVEARSVSRLHYKKKKKVNATPGPSAPPNDIEIVDVANNELHDNISAPIAALDPLEPNGNSLEHRPSNLEDTDMADSHPGHIPIRSQDSEPAASDCLSESLDSESEIQSAASKKYINPTELDFVSNYADSTGGQFVLPSQWTEPTDVSRAGQRFARIDLNRPNDDYTRDEIRNLELAAGYLFALKYGREASLLYCLTVKWHRNSPETPDWHTFAATIQYARASKVDTHLTIVQDLLRKQMVDESDPLKLFLCHALLAYTDARTWRPDTDEERTARMIDHLEKARQLFNTGEVFSWLPESERGLDLMTFSVMSWFASQPSRPVEVDDLHTMFGPIDDFKSPFEEQLASLNPGPFELKDGAMQNPCLRSCIRWCARELASIATNHPTPKRRTWITERRTRKPMKRLVLLGAERLMEMELMDHLWGELQEQCSQEQDSQEQDSQEQDSQEQDSIMEMSSLNPESDIFWIEQAIPRMGLSPAMLLRIVLTMDPSDEPFDKRARDRYILDMYHLGVTSFVLKEQRRRVSGLGELSDEKLINLFVTLYHHRNSLENEENPLVDFVIDTVREIQKESILERLRKSMILLPRETQRNSGSRSLRGSFVNVLETLAPGALDTESLRAFKTKWKQRSKSILSFGATWRHSDEDAESQLSYDLGSLNLSG